MRATALALCLIAAAAPAWAQQGGVSAPVRAALDACRTPGAPGLAARAQGLAAQGWALAGRADADAVAGAEAMYLVIGLIQPAPGATEADRALLRARPPVRGGRTLRHRRRDAAGPRRAAPHRHPARRHRRMTPVSA